MYFLKKINNIKKIIQCGDMDDAGIPELVGDGDEVQFSILDRYG